MSVTETQKANPLNKLGDLGQSVWLDYIRRSLLTSGELTRLIEEDGLRGITSNPAIFEKAIAGSNDYSDVLKSLQATHDDPMATYEAIAIRDIQDAAEALKTVYYESMFRDGYVSLEVSPYLARDTERTLVEARRLWAAVDKPNLMIKVPATEEGIPAIEQLISEGINVNVTLIFSRKAYDKVAEAFISGLERLSASNHSIGKVASVASFFVSRIDAAIDAFLREKLKSTTGEAERKQIESCLGKIAIANAKLAYQDYKQRFSGPRWDKLAARNAQTQRILWASTGAKDPAFRDVIYVEELVGVDTVNTIPPATFDAFRDHGQPRLSLEKGVDEAEATMNRLAGLDVSIDSITDQLLDKGLVQFAEAFDKLLRAVDSRCGCEGDFDNGTQSYKLPKAMSGEVENVVAEWKAAGNVRRLWNRDASLWTGTDEASWLGWLGITEDQLAHSDRLAEFAVEVKAEGFSHVLLLGMGGSSLCPDVLKSSFGVVSGFPELLVLDSTDPAQIETVANKVDLKNTLFIVSSKSGSTTEPNIFKQYFFERVEQLIGKEKAGLRFITVTDPGSKLQRVAERDGFRDIFHGLPSIGGRYSALSKFGMVPAAAMGIDVRRFLDRADEMAVACSACVPLEENPGAMLGIILGVACTSGRDKVTIAASPAVRGLGAWLEQLLAESTGKNGLGIVPVDREELAAPNAYGEDRIFVYVRHESLTDAEQDNAIEALEAAGQPVVRVTVTDAYDLGREFFRWEIATAVAGAVIGINPFNQPDVEASKIATRELTDAYEKMGTLPAEEPFFEDEGVQLFADANNQERLKAGLDGSESLVSYLRSHVNQLSPCDYFGLLAYIEMNHPHDVALQSIRHQVRDKFKVATVLGFGPRFLHSTGQAYKGGPNTGVFLQVTCDDAKDLAVPKQSFTFGVVKAAQARGDFQVLADRKRRALRIHLKGDLQTSLATLEATITEALS